jgi:hypothetical protein
VAGHFEVALLGLLVATALPIEALPDAVLTNSLHTMGVPKSLGREFLQHLVSFWPLLQQNSQLLQMVECICLIAWVDAQEL